MPSDVAVFASIAVTLVSSLAGVAAVGAGVHTYWRRAVRRPAPVGQLEHDRLARLEEAMDAIVLEIERIAEGQRFLTRLHVERTTDADAGALSDAPPTPG